VKAVSVDVERNVDLAMNQFITSLPTLFMFKDGQKIAEQTGMVSPARLREITSVALP
jgi:thioredoxin-like negative regulator of GroEL